MKTKTPRGKTSDKRQRNTTWSDEALWQPPRGMRFNRPYQLSEYAKMSAKELRKRVFLDIEELLGRATLEESGYKAERETSIKALVHLSVNIASRLESLACIQPEFMCSIAAESDLWPVNLGLKKAKNGKTALRRVTFAKVYLRHLGLSSCPTYRHSERSGAVSETPFKAQAIEFWNQMSYWKEPWVVCTIRIKTPWVKRLLALKSPMTRKNAADWWKVGQVYLSERWKLAPEEFAPLVKHLGLELSAKTPYPSKIKSRVIDNDLKDAFLALAVAD